MNNPVYEQIQARKVKARLRILQHAQRVSGNVTLQLPSATLTEIHRWSLQKKSS